MEILELVRESGSCPRVERTNGLARGRDRLGRRLFTRGTGASGAICATLRGDGRRRRHVGARQAGGSRRVHRVRERPGPAAGAVADGRLSSPPTRRTTALEIFRVSGRAPAVAGLGAGGPRAGRRRGAQRRRGLGGQPPLRQRQHRRRRATPTQRARGAHAARRRRAARHRLRRARTASARSSPPPTAARTAPSIRSSPRPASAAPTSGCSTPTTSATRSAATPLTDHHALHRHAARAGGDARRQHASTRPASTPATRRPSISELHRRRGGRRPAAARHQLRRASPQPPTGLIVKFDGDSHWVDERRAALGRRRQVLAARQGRLRHRRARRTRRRRSPARRLLRRRRDHPLQHGRQPGEREGLRLQHRRAQRRPLRGARAPSRGHRTVRGHLAESRITVLDPAPAPSRRAT